MTSAVSASAAPPSTSAPARSQHPAWIAVREKRAADVQLRVADAITRFAGSMKFVYIHAVVFAVWMLVVEKSPWPTLTLVVSLEAIFLSTFVMIGQNRQGEYAQTKAEHDFNEQEQELHVNTDLTRQIHELTTQIHTLLVAAGQAGAAPPSTGD
ncbi:MAG TPA: DUF1003 domain-containing protein [Ilumatobacteraceae bacterium]